MQAKLITYTTEGLNKSQKSILSKRMYGYTDKSNKGQYTYKREGILNNTKHVKVCNNTFIIYSKDWSQVKNKLKRSKLTIKEWDIDIKDF